MYVDFGTQHLGGDERTDVEPYAVIEVWIPSDRLLAHLLPAHVDVVRRHTVEDQFEPSLQFQRRREARIRACPTRVCLVLLPLYPCPKDGERELLQRAMAEPMIIDYRGEPVLATVPDVPQERPVVEDADVLRKEDIPQPIFKPTALAAGIGDEGAFEGA